MNAWTSDSGMRQSPRLFGSFQALANDPPHSSFLAVLSVTFSCRATWAVVRCCCPNRFNVAVSRAKLVLHVLGNENWAERCGITFVSDLLRRCREASAKPGGRAIRTDLIGPVWEPRFAEALRRAGLPVEQQYPAGGYYLDIALLRKNLKLDIEVDGECHRDVDTGRRRIDDVYRDMVLESLGWEVVRFWVYELREHFDECVERVTALFNRRDDSNGDV